MKKKLGLCVCLLCFLFCAVSVQAKNIEVLEEPADGGGGMCEGNIVVENAVPAELTMEPMTMTRRAARSTVLGISNVSNVTLMNDYGLRLHQTWGGCNVRASSGVVSSPYWQSTGLRWKGSEWIEVTYENTGTYRGQAVDVRVTFRPAYSYNSYSGGDDFWNHSKLLINPDFMGGMTYIASAQARISYEFLYAGTNTRIPLSSVYFSFGSMNTHEGWYPSNYSSARFYKQSGAYPNVYSMRQNDLAGQVEAITWPDHNWCINLDLDGNNFEDNVHAATFWKSVATVDVTTNTPGMFSFDMFPFHFWFCPTVTNVGAVAPPPTKVIKDGTENKLFVTKHSGDTVLFQINQEVESLGYQGTGMLKYSNFSFADTLPEGVTYNSARILRGLNGIWTDVTSNGTLSYNASTRRVGFSFSGSYLNNGMAYQGESYVLEINTTLQEGTETRELLNQGSTTICNTLQSTNTVRVKQEYYPVKTKIRWRQVDGTWTEYTDADSRMAELHDDYSYTWVRGTLREESENVYYDADPKSVFAEDVSAENTFYMDVERKKYSYRFDPNQPEGYAFVGNLQDNLVDQWAETISGSVKSPSLTGYTFLGWNTKRDGSGDWYQSESMLSNKTFYAIWRKNKYQVHYDPNSSSNPSHEDGERTQNVVTGTMANSEFEYDTMGTLRMNAFVRAGYEFIGWNTKADGTGLAYGESAYDISGKRYSDGYPKVWNMTIEDGVTLTLYAQWKKKLGNERLTVVSEETGARMAGIGFDFYQKINGSWVKKQSFTTDGNGQISVSDLHWFDYKYVCTSVPDGYELCSDVVWSVDYVNLSFVHERILYLTRVTVVLDSRVNGIIAGERSPSFTYQVSGVDAAGVRHSYVVEVPVNGNMLQGSSVLSGIYAGTYTVTNLPVSRYVAQPSQDISHSTPNGIHSLVDVLRYDRAEVLFPYVLRQYEGFGSMDERSNTFASVRVAQIRSLLDVLHGSVY